MCVATKHTLSIYYMTTTRPCKNCLKEFKHLKTGYKRGYPKQYCPECRKEKDDERALRSILKRNYGITIEQREAKRLEQNDKCAICKCDNSGDRDFHVDHDHKSNKFRGLLCFNCNLGLGKFLDSPELLRAAALYVETNYVSRSGS